MTAHSSQPACELGMIGLGTMGRNFLFNLGSHGFSCAGFDKDRAAVEKLRGEAKEGAIIAADSIQDFTRMLRVPRTIMLLVPAGKIVDSVIDELLPHIQPGDLIIYGGNSYFKDTSYRMRRLNAKGIDYMGLGISGGEEGARFGPSMMPGGKRESYELVRRMFEAAAAAVDGEPCVAYLGPDAAGHFVKMVHNGIEYALMQLIAESYDLMKRGLGMNDDELRTVYADWNSRELKSFLIEISSQIFGKVDQATGARLIDKILDVAHQKGTGMWTSQSAMELHVPTPTIDIAVSMRDMSVLERERKQASDLYGGGGVRAYDGGREGMLVQLEHGITAGMIISYAQGFQLLSAASSAFAYGFDNETVARIWRGGCIIRSALLEDIRAAYRAQPSLQNLLLDHAVAEKMKACEADLRTVVSAAAALHLPMPALTSVLSYFDAFRSAWLPANLIQAQRDYFGAHTYERTDAKGTFHTEWNR
jgi:6-phosphogluconate dehydrogenase